MKKYEYYKPRSLQEAWSIVQGIPGAKYIAGGTDILVKIKNRQLETAALRSGAVGN